MRQIKDALNRDWVLSLNFASAKRMRDLAGVDIMDFEKGFGFLDDPVLFGRVVFSLLLPDVQRAGLSEEDFARGFDGATLDRVGEAYLEEFENFFPGPKRRAVIKGALKEAFKNLTSGNVPANSQAPSESIPTA